MKRARLRRGFSRWTPDTVPLTCVRFTVPGTKGASGGKVAQARSTRTANEAFQERVGVCRDFAHLAIALCRCLNIPARYCNGYLGDIGVPPDPAPMDFNAWFEVYLGGAWRVFDARHNEPRIGRVLVARGMDASDIAMITAFGNHTLRMFKVHTEEVAHPVGPHAASQKLDATVVPMLTGRAAA